MSKGLILWCWIQCGRHAPLSKEDTGDNQDDPLPNRQAIAGQFHWHGDIHGELGLPLGSNGKLQLSEDKGLNCQDSSSTTQILCQNKGCGGTGPCITERTWCLLVTRRPAHCLSQQEPHRHWDEVCQHRKGTPCHCIHLSVVQHVHPGQSFHSGVRPQATGNDTSEEPCKVQMLLQLQWYDVTIRYRPGKKMLLTDALSRCPSQASGEIKLDMRVNYIFQQDLDHQT